MSDPVRLDDIPAIATRPRRERAFHAAKQLRETERVAGGQVLLVSHEAALEIAELIEELAVLAENLEW